METKFANDIVLESIKSGKTVKEICEELEREGCFLEIAEEYAGYEYLHCQTYRVYNTLSAAIAAEFNSDRFQDTHCDNDILDGTEDVSALLCERGYFFSFSTLSGGAFTTLDGALNESNWDLFEDQEGTFNI